ncbi:cell division protein FtsQ/DivIB [Ottowia sp.]|uniref:cell division protein FtsQ/DivIB n=1 Tax=Ottowia sp. TaxID=1898956 RepID=UPI002607C706|nr:cell division protein FtsQ/DivIB [Ottowia sp.]
MSDALPLPLDVRLMNFTVSLLLTTLVLGCVAAGLWWVLRNPAFAIRSITLEGDTAHNSAASLRASVLPRLSGNFFTMDLDAARTAFQAAPWVRAAQVQRVFPDKLNVTLREHVPVALWGEGDNHLIDQQGDVFEASAPDGDSADMPRLAGPQGQSALVLSAYRTLAAALAPARMRLRGLELTPRGSWRAELGGGGLVELGRGTPEELAARLAPFVATVGEVAARHQRNPQDIESADLRHTTGYALRLRGVTTVSAEERAKSGAGSAPARRGQR